MAQSFVIKRPTGARVEYVAAKNDGLPCWTQDFGPALKFEAQQQAQAVLKMRVWPIGFMNGAEEVA
jgi:hypothetical protein